MMTDLQNVANAGQQQGETEHSGQSGPTQQALVGGPAAAPEGTAAGHAAPAQLPVGPDAAAALSAAVRRHREERPLDLFSEGANMLELQRRQSRCLTSLSLSSKATQALLSQF